MSDLLRRALLAWCLVLGALARPPIPVTADAATPWTPGPNAVGDDTYTGFVDVPVPGASLTPNSQVLLQGWVVDRTAVGWSGIDDVEIYSGLQDQGGTLLVRAAVNQRRDDVAAAFGNPYWATAGFSGAFSESNLPSGPNVLTVYAHTPEKGWWYRQLQVNVPAPPDLAFADDPLLIVREAEPSLDVSHTTPTLTLTGYAIDRNVPLSLQLGVGGSGVSRIQAYLDGPRNGGAGIFVGNAQLGLKNREATGFGDRFLMSGWQLTFHPSDFSVDRHEFFIYALSAFWPNESLVIVPFNVH
jgi:hypothetical protein